MEQINTYILIIAASLIIILSYFFNVISKKTNIPSVIMLLALGVTLRYILISTIGEIIDFTLLLELLGIVGLIMIVLEASLDLKLNKKKLPLLLKALGVSLFSLILTAFLLSFVFVNLLHTDLLNALIYAIPLSIMSSAIVIPSVVNLEKNKKEFMIYESTFSDILGIMFFFFIIQSSEYESIGGIFTSISLNLLLTLVISVLASYTLIYFFHKLQSEIRLFLLIAVLILLYAFGKMLHLSSLFIILAFGLILNNQNLFFKGKLKKYIHTESLENVYKQLHLVTIESSFVVRTFFFVIFGLSISLVSLLNVNVLLISLLVSLFIYLVRWLALKIFMRKNFLLELFTAPRGLITILLFFNIPTEFQIAEFQSEILLVTIIASSIIMAVGMIKFGKKTQTSRVIPSPETNIANEVADLLSEINIPETNINNKRDELGEENKAEEN